MKNIYNKQTLINMLKEYVNEDYGKLIEKELTNGRKELAKEYETEQNEILESIELLTN